MNKYLKLFLEENQDLINDGDFEQLFKNCVKEEGMFSEVTSQLYELIVKAFPELKIDRIAPQYQVFLHKIKDKEVKIVGPIIEDAGIEEEYASHLGERATILNIFISNFFGVPDQYNFNASNQQNFDESAWLIKTTNGEELKCCGRNLKLLSPIEFDRNGNVY